MNFKRLIRKCIAGSYVVRTKAFASFSQTGEDLIVSYLFHQLRIEKPTYLDIGTNYPVSANNTYFFYNKGFTGVCIEPDPEIYKVIKKKRPKDIVLNAGIGFDDSNSAELYIFPDPYSGWNTFSEEDAKYREKESGISILKKIKIPLLSINSVIEKYLQPHPNFISIDVEGLDLAILQTLDFEKYKPEIICAETITFSTKNEEQKITTIANFLQAKGYFVFADTHVNTIFCKKDAYKKIH
jgi:FkbM family methyltransferase